LKGKVPGNLHLAAWDPSGKPAEEVVHSKRVCIDSARRKARSTIQRAAAPAKSKGKSQVSHMAPAPETTTHLYPYICRPILPSRSRPRFRFEARAQDRHAYPRTCFAPAKPGSVAYPRRMHSSSTTHVLSSTRATSICQESWAARNVIT